VQREKEVAEEDPGDEAQDSEGDASDDEGAGSDDGGDDAPEDDDASDEEDSEDSAISDELLERAIKAGLSIAEIRKFPGAEPLEVVCDKLESLGGETDASDAGSNEAEETVGDIVESIPDLDPEDYEEELVNSFQALKDVIRLQQETIDGLRGSKQEEGQSWLDAKIGGLSGAAKKELKSVPEKADKLREQYEVLMAGYASAGKTVKQDEVFDQAVIITLGDVINAAKRQSTEERMRDREGRFIARPEKRDVQTLGDPFEEVAKEIDQEIESKT
jgi:hypothetical protein